MRTALIAAMLLAAAASGSAQTYATTIPSNHPAIRYAETPSDDAASRLARQLEAGARRLTVRDDSYLPDLLSALQIPVDSQALVFSKTSFQAGKISPRNPRAIYFNDEVAVGWVRGGNGIEIAALDPRQGISFYTLATTPTEKPQIVRRQECLHCHQGSATLGVPGIFVGSVYPDASGMPSRDAAIITDHSTPFADRWGGWYVNAKKGQQQDRSNTFATDPVAPRLLDTIGKRNLLDLTRQFSPTGYLSPVSDIVALLTFEHQTKMTNLLIRAGWEYRTSGRIAIDAAADYMLFAGEAPLTEPVEGASSFASSFAARGPCDSQGRSLRQFDLKTRLFRYPLSYMIYSAAFDGLPDTVRASLYQRLYQRLTAAGAGPKIPALDVDTKRALVEIARQTKTNLPDFWKAEN